MFVFDNVKYLKFGLDFDYLKRWIGGICLNGNGDINISDVISDAD